MSKKAKYRVDGDGPFCVEDRGGIVYDLIDSKTEAEAICKILNKGIGPEWDVVEPELRKLGL